MANNATHSSLAKVCFLWLDLNHISWCRLIYFCAQSKIKITQFLFKDINT